MQLNKTGFHQHRLFERERSSIRLWHIATIFLVLLHLSGCADLSTSRIAYIHEGVIYQVPAGGGEPEPMIGDAEYDRPITWSPSGETLLYWKHSDIGWDIWAVDASGGNPHNLTEVRRGGCRSPVWSPDGKQIAFMRDLPNGLYVMNADGGEQHHLSELGHRDETPAWSPSGQHIAFSHLQSIGDGTARMDVVLWSPNPELSEKTLSAEWWRDSPFWLDEHTVGFCGTHDGRHEVWVQDLRTQKVRSLTRTEGRVHYPRLSPDGRQLACIVATEDQNQLIVTDVDQYSPQTLATFSGRSWFPSWSPDSRWLTYAVRESDRPSEVYVVGLDQPHKKRIATGSYPVWRPQP